MKIYEFLGIDHLLMDIPIPQEVILENVDAGSYDEAVAAFRNIGHISLRVSLNRDEHYLQVMEIGLTSPREISAIARIIQKTIKYRILFIFTYQDRYLILWRNFKITDSTEYVYTDAVTYCTDWIYEESLDMDVLWSCNITRINNEQSRIVPLSFKKKNKNDDDGMAYFRDVVQNVYRVSVAIINREVVCARYLLDWSSCHAVGERIDLNYLLCEAIREEMYMVIEDSLFFEKDRLEFLCSEIVNPNYRYKTRIGRTGRVPWSYFESIAFPATYDDEYEILSRLHEVITCDGQYLVSLINDHSYDFPTKRETRYVAPLRQAALEEAPKKSVEQQKREEEYLASVEQESSTSREKQNAEEDRRLAEDRQKAEEARRQEEARQQAEEEARRKAEEERRLEEEGRKAEQARRQEEARRQAEEEARRKAEEERRLTEERKRFEEARRQEEAHRQAEEDARCRAEEERRLAEERRKTIETRTGNLTKGIVVGAELDANRGPVATLIVQQGILNKGDIIVIGAVVGRIRLMKDKEKGYVEFAKPFACVKIIGLSNVPSIGDTFEVVADADTARNMAEANSNVNAAKTKSESTEKATTHSEHKTDSIDRAKKYIGFTNNSMYFNWLSMKVSSEFMDEIIMAYEIIQRFAITNKLLIKPLLETTNVVQVRSVQDAVRNRNEFTDMKGNSRYFCGLAMRHYVQYISELEAKHTEHNAKPDESRQQEEVQWQAEEEARRKAEEERRLAEERQKSENAFQRKEILRLIYALNSIKEDKHQADLLKVITILKLVDICNQVETVKRQNEARRQAKEDVRRKAEEEQRLVVERQKTENMFQRNEILRLVYVLNSIKEVKCRTEHLKAVAIWQLVDIFNQVETAKRKNEARRQAEEELRRKVEEEQRLAEECRKAEEARRKEEIQRQAEEDARCKAEEERRLAEEHRKVEEARRQEESRRKAEEEARRNAENERRLAEEKRAQYRRNNRCQHCGGEFKAFLGVFSRKCKICEKAKDY